MSHHTPANPHGWYLERATLALEVSRRLLNDSGADNPMGSKKENERNKSPALRAKKRTGLRCGGRGKSEISPALLNAQLYYIKKLRTLLLFSRKNVLGRQRLSTTLHPTHDTTVVSKRHKNLKNNLYLVGTSV